MENINANMSMLSSGLEDQFISLMQQGMAFSNEAKIDSKLYEQVWSPQDLNPDRLTSEINKIFIYNETETKRHNYSDIYFNLNKTHAEASAAAGSGAVNVLWGLVTAGGSGSSSESALDYLAQTSQSIFSQTDIQHLLSQQSIETEWSGEKLFPKSFSVYKLTDITDRLQVAIIAKQLIADKSNGAIIRTINTINKPLIAFSRPSVLTGAIQMYTPSSPPPLPWLLCNGTAISRIEYQKLFSVIGVTYGAGDGFTTFNIPDFKGRFPLGVDKLQERVENAIELGMIGGQATQRLTVEHLPPHKHGKGTFSVASSGTHSHSISDPGHNHGGSTGGAPQGLGTWGEYKNGNGDNNRQHAHSINTDWTRITINANGAHIHDFEGETGSVGVGQNFDTISPYQTVNYIIYTD
ncbi:unnamed protein product [Adineta steineri]|nr:unnamed protein product [Adineta steineri]